MGTYGRNRNSTHIDQWSYMTQILNGGSPTNYGPFRQNWDYEAMSDTITPNYHERVANGEIINKDCSYQRVRITSSDTTVRFTRKSDGWWFSQSGAMTQNQNAQKPFNRPVLITGSDLDTAMREAKSHALSQIAAPEWSFGEDVMEAKETLKFLRQPAASLAEVAKAFEKKSRYLYRDLGDRAKALAGAWASYRFAMLPLQRSLEDIVESSFRKTKAKAKNTRLSARGKRVLNGDTGMTKQNWSTTVFDFQRSHNIDIRANILYQCSSDLDGWQYKYGLRLRDFPKTAWELVPYSFMVDRVANISKCISGLVNLSDPSIRILAASVTKRETLRDYVKWSTDTDPTWTISGSGNPYERTDFWYVRDKWTPSAFDTIPTVNFGNLVKDATSVIDLLSLTLQRISFGKIFPK